MISGLSQRFIEYKDVFCYRPNIREDLAKISQVALGTIALLCVVVSRYCPMRLVVPLALTSAFFAWTFPLLFGHQLKPNYDVLEPLGITEEEVEEFNTEAAEGRFAKLERFLGNLSNDLVGQFKQQHLFPALAPLIQKGVEEGKISEVASQKVFPLFRKHGIFDARNFPPNVKVVGRDGKEFRANKTVLLISSPFLKTAFKVDFKEKADQKIDFPSHSGGMYRRFSLFSSNGNSQGWFERT